MKSRTPIVIAGVAILAVAVVAGGYYMNGSKTSHVAAMSVPLDVPVGITLQPIGAGQGYGIESHAQFGTILAFDTAYADARGLTLYTYDKDTAPGQSSCTGDCAKAWPAALADKNAKPFGDWSVIDHEGGAKQWAYKGKPLYTFVKDTDPGSINGASPRPANPGPMGGRLVQPGPMPEGWHAVLYQPSAGMALPRGIAVHDVAEAMGQALVDSKGMTLYAFDGDANRDKPVCATLPCPNPWVPMAAPQLAEAIGDFSFLVRDDGVKQWVFKGHPLYRYDGDLAAGYANGTGVDPHWQVALVSRHFMPSDASIQRTPGRGKVMATAAGLTLYKREAVGYSTGGGHSFRHGVLIRPGVAREIGTKGCDSECLKSWHPFTAPADAQSSGFWDVVTRPDGTKQWAYWGSALYTYSGDKKAGDMSGNDIYDIALSDDPNTPVNVGTPEVGAAALYWLIAEP